MLTRYMEINKWWMGQFPESAYTTKNHDNYVGRVLRGCYRMKDSTALFCAIARNVEETLPYTIARIERSGGMFKAWHCFIYENDSTDNTKNILAQWSKCPNITVVSEDLGKVRHKQDMTLDRTKDMAQYRNRYLDFAKTYRPTWDYMLVFDTDLQGGWSYEGVANSFGHEGWDVIGSNGLIYRNNPDNNNPEKLYYDTYAWRYLDDDTIHDEKVNLMKLNRGEEPFMVNSCFGGLAIYRNECIASDIEYKGNDCDHPTLHKQIRNNGHTVWCNPSQITVYSPTRYSGDVDKS